MDRKLTLQKSTSGAVGLYNLDISEYLEADRVLKRLVDDYRLNINSMSLDEKRKAVNAATAQYQVVENARTMLVWMGVVNEEELSPLLALSDLLDLQEA